MFTFSIPHAEKSRCVIGLTQDSSDSGVNVVLLRIENAGVDLHFKVEYTFFKPYPAKMKELVSQILNEDNVSLGEINYELAKFCSETIFEMLAKNNEEIKNIHVAGIQGLKPRKTEKNKHAAISSVDPSVLAQLTGITTVGGLEISNGDTDGSGTSPMSYLYGLIFKKLTRNVLCLNIEDITNITFVSKHVKTGEFIVLDSGPGNILIDQMMQRLYEIPNDQKGEKSLIGKFSQRFFDLLVKEDAFSQLPLPRSNGENYYGPEFILKILRKAVRWRLSEPDVIHTVTKYTAFTIWSAWQRFIRQPIQMLIVGGNGALNEFLTQSITEYFKGIEVKKMSDFSLDEKFKEAVSIAVLANEFINGKARDILTSDDKKKYFLTGKIYSAYLT